MRKNLLSITFNDLHKIYKIPQPFIAAAIGLNCRTINVYTSQNKKMRDIDAERVLKALNKSHRLAKSALKNALKLFEENSSKEQADENN